MIRRIRDMAAEVRGHREFTADIRREVEAGDAEAAATFRTGTLSAALTRKGNDARGAEVVEYVQAVKGEPGRTGWLRRR
ncbi:hypothetical protein [Streptomyces sp. NPDC012450]|uniref:hypothetical protein n=1 Tax=Streptomyces sp. NPDC012450 TaxID=3364834 RepID=UPI0036EFA7EF